MEGCSKYQIFAAKFTKVKKEEGCMKDRVDDERNSGAGYTRKVYQKALTAWSWDLSPKSY